MRVKGNQMNMVSRIGAVKPLAAIAVVIALASTAVWQSSAQAQSTGICGRTAQVQEVILHETGVSNCANVTAKHLSGITGILNLSPADLPDLQAIITTPITSLKAGDFAGLSGVTDVRLNENKVQRIDRNMLTGLTSLERLTLDDLPHQVYGGRLTLASDVFADVPTLKVLYMRWGRLSTLASGTFSGLTSLEELHLSSNGLTSLPEDLFEDLDSLENLDLGANRLTALPEDIFDGLDTLEKLSIGNNSLTALPADIFDGLDSLEWLHFQNNQITVLPDGIFDGLDELERLSFSGNQIAELPDGIFTDLNSLRYVSAHENTGAPFDIVVDLESDGTEVYATVAEEGAPSEITVTLTVEDGDGTTGILSTDTLTVSGGGSKSDAASITSNDDYPDASPAIASLAFGHPTLVSGMILVTAGNTPATGAPTISGTAQVGQTLTASTTGISDADGLTNVTYSYEWLSGTSPHPKGRNSSYTIKRTDRDLVLKVRVTFTDDGGSNEALTSEGTAEVVLGGL